ncbi:hypothetical protein VTO42DRAFT_1878 [Malbranchea cinnamomea]
MVSTRSVAEFHDLLDKRCDPYVNVLLCGQTEDLHCHSNLTRGNSSVLLTEFDVHDVINVFQVTGLDEKGRHFMETCPYKRMDYFEFFAGIKILCALSTYPGGDLSNWGWDKEMNSNTRPLGVEMYSLTGKALLDGWRSLEPLKYTGFHGLSIQQQEPDDRFVGVKE